MKRRIGWTGLAVSGAVLLFLLFPAIFTPPWQDNYRDIALDWLSGILGAMFVRRGLWLRVCARSYKAGLCVDGRTLVKDGPYALARNPMYLGSFLLGLGISIILASAWVVAVFAGVFLFVYQRVIRGEEQRLRGCFGQEYAEYCRRVPRFFPCLRLIARGQAMRLLSLKPGWLRRELPTIAAALAGIALLEAYQDIPVFGWWPYLAEMAMMGALLGSRE